MKHLPDSDLKAWTEGSRHEVDFWSHWAIKPDYLAGRIEPMRILQREITSRIKVGDDKLVRVLEVGCGPLTILGNRWPGHTLEVEAVDPLADEYNAILEKAGVSGPVKTKKCYGEELTQLFPENHFDYAQAYNCLDHSLDPLLCIEELVKVTKPGGLVVLVHYRNESDNQTGIGLHGWNFDLRDQQFIIEGKGKVISVDQVLANKATLLSTLVENQIRVEITKR